MTSGLKVHAIKAVFFDAVGTLLHPQPSAVEVYADCGRRFGVDLELDTVAHRFRQALSKSWGPETSEEVERGCWQNVVASVFPEVPDAGGELFESLWEHFSNPQSWRLAAGVADLWMDLRQLGIQLGIASNFDQRLQKVCAGCPPLNQCSLIFCSAQLGYAKPHVMFFEAIQSQIGFQPHELLMVGDDWEKDCRGAIQSGWQAVWVDDTQPTPVGSSDSIVRVKNLSNLGGLLANHGGFLV